jgi:hypothetical protein
MVVVSRCLYCGLHRPIPPRGKGGGQKVAYCGGCSLLPFYPFIYCMGKQMTRNSYSDRASFFTQHEPMHIAGEMFANVYYRMYTGE